MPLESVVRNTADSVGEERLIEVLHIPMKALVGSLQKCELGGFLVKTRKLVMSNCLPLLVS